ncbi:MAG: MFS transporter [Acidimicrobiia bacterium]
MKKWWPLVALGAAQFLMVLDQSVMNVSISQLVEDFNTEVTVIQAVITLYSLVMAALMMLGGKIGDRVGRRRAFAIGMVVYACGSALTAASWSVATLALGWSILEGIGAVLVLPALVALVAGNYEGRERALAFGVIGGIAGAGIAVGPVVGGWCTTELSWRVVFVGEVVIAAVILLLLRQVRDVARPDPRPHIDGVGAFLSATGLGLVVFGVLQASTWGWVAAKSSPVEPLGFALTPFVIGAGGVVLWAFTAWQRRREAQREDPLVHLRLFRSPRLRSGLGTFLAQNLVLMGIFFVIPLYLQIVLGFDALETGLRMVPTSVAMLVTALGGAQLTRWFSPRAIVRAGLVLLLVATIFLIATIDPELNGTNFAIAMTALGIGLGLIASQLGNVVQSSVGAVDRGEAGGLQYTAQQLGSALGVALIGAMVITSLANNFVDQVSSNPEIADEVSAEVSTNLGTGIDFVPSSEVSDAASAAGLDDETSDALVDSYEEAQLDALKAGLFAVAIIVAASLLATRHLPTRRLDELGEEPAEALDARATAQRQSATGSAPRLRSSVRILAAASAIDSGSGFGSAWSNCSSGARLIGTT